MKKFKFTRILLIIVAVIAVAYAVCPQYLRKALVYQQVDIDDYKIFDNRVVIAGNSEPWAEIPGYDKKEIPAPYVAQFDKFKTVAFLVIKDQKILFEKFWDGYSPDSKSNSFSMAKSIVSLLIGIAMDEGFIQSVDQPVGDYLPEFKEGDKARVTIRHLLEMSSGLSWDEAYSSAFSMTTKGYYGKDLPGLVLNQTVLREPGIFHDYKSGNTQLLALILERAVHQKVSSYASEKLWIPMGAQHDALWSVDKPNGVEKAYCCFNTDDRDFARFGQLILNHGKWNGKQLVSESYLKQALTPASHLIDVNGKNVDYYGWQWWLMKYRGYDVDYMRGVNGQYVIVIPDINTIIVRLGHKRATERINGIPADFFTWIDTGLELAGEK
ncbi:MAG: serine hydrolase [Bacteroidales bacterium]|jgi:CubicO group peptidase (beta-lactamase class C family)